MLSSLTAQGVFYFLAAIIVIFAALTVTLKNIFHCALSLVMALLGVAGIYIYLEAEFLAIIQVLVFVGAIMTLIIFAIMLTLQIADKNLKQHNEQKAVSFLICAVFGVFFIFALALFSRGLAQAGPAQQYSLADIGRELLTKYALPFEVVSVVLLAALIGAVVISSKDQA